MYKKKIVDEEMDFDTLLKFINELSGHIDLERAMRDAEALFHLAAWVLFAYLQTPNSDNLLRTAVCFSSNVDVGFCATCIFL